MMITFPCVSLDGDPYQRHIEDCVARVSIEAARQLRDPATRPANMSTQTAQRLAGSLGLDAAAGSSSASSSGSSGVMGAVKGLFQSSETAAAGQQGEWENTVI